MTVPTHTSRSERAGLLTLLAVTLAAYLVNLDANGWANAFYSAAAQAGSQSWSAFFFGSLDAANAITVDKPPASLWVMGLSVRLFGLGSWQILVPQVLMGVAAVAVLYAAVRRTYGAGAGLLAGLLLATTPVAVLMFRFNNPDALLTLLMTVAAWATLRALENGRTLWYAVSGLALGLGFLTKTLQVLLVVPFIGLAWLFLGSAPWRRRLRGALVGTGVALLSAGWWVAVVELLPASMRPYVGGSQNDSFLELTFGYNGLGRIEGTEVGSVGQRGPNSGTGSIWRLLDGANAGQISWLLPAALLLLVAGLLWRGRLPLADQRRAALIVFGGWLVVTGLTFSLMEGIFHEYYSVALAPAVAAVTAMGAAETWQRRASVLARMVLAAAVGVTAWWSWVQLTSTDTYGSVLPIAVLVIGAMAAMTLLLGSWLPQRVVAGAAVAAVAASVAGPLAYDWTTVHQAQQGSIVTAGPAAARGPGPGGGGPGGRMPGARSDGTAMAPPSGGAPGGAPGQGMPPMPPAGVGGAGGTGGTGGPSGAGASGVSGGRGGLLGASTPSAAVTQALLTDADRYTWIAATVGAQNAAGVQLATERPVMAIGGFNGSDPAPTLAEFQALVREGRVHWFLASGGFGRQNGGSTASREISQWVTSSFETTTVDGATLYDLTKPVSAAVSAATASES